MDIFKNLVPLVAFYAPTGKEKHLGSGVIVSSQYGYSAKFDGKKPSYVPAGQDLITSVGETFKGAKVAELIKSGYDRNSEGKLIVKPLPDAPKIWRVVELYK